jgi:hypothetical protein
MERQMAPPETSGKKYLGKRAVGARYGGKSDRTVDRWVASGILPPPDLYMSNRPLWADETLDHHDRQAVVTRAAVKGQPADQEGAA